MREEEFCNFFSFALLIFIAKRVIMYGAGI